MVLRGLKGLGGEGDLMLKGVKTVLSRSKWSKGSKVLGLRVRRDLNGL